MQDFEAVDTDDKLNLLMSAINKINATFHYKLESVQQQLSKELKDKFATVEPRVQALENYIEELEARVADKEALLTEVTELKQRIESLELQSGKTSDGLGTVKGILQVHDKAITANKTKITDLTARSMANNILIFGLDGDSAEEKDCGAKVRDFLRTKLLMELEDDEVEIAHRIGKKTSTKPRQMVVRCKQSLRNRIFQYTKNLKDLKNANGDYMSFKPQLPEPLLSERIEREEKLRAIRKANASIPEDQQHKAVKVHIKNKTLYVNDVPDKVHVHPPTVREIFNTDRLTQGKMEELTFVHTDDIVEKSSVFRGHAIHLKNAKEVRTAYRKLRQLFPESDHVIMAYHVKSFTGHCDHGEYGAGRRLLGILMNQGYADTVVFVTRDYGGIQLGQRRFLFIEKVAKQALNMLL